MRTSHVLKHSRCHADSECVSYVSGDRKEAEFIGNKFTHSLTHKQTYRHSFLRRDTMRKRGLYCRPVTVCPSVCMSVRHVGGLYPDG